MPNVRFNLNNTQAQSSAILLYYNYDNNRLKVSTGLSIDTRFWNPKNQRVRERTEFPHHARINAELDELKLLVERIYNEHLELGVRLQPHALRKALLEAKGDQRKSIDSNSFWKHYDDFVAYKRNQLGDVRDYDNSLRKHLLKAEEKYGARLNFLLLKNLPNGFVDTFEHYLTYEAVNHSGKRGLSVNTIGKQFKTLKVFLHWCFDREVVPSFSLKHLVTRSEEVESIYLKEQEIEALRALELDDEEEISVRDLFLIGCETGLRFSDFSRLQPHHIKKDRIEIHQQKGKAKVTVPICSEVLEQLLEKYDNAPPQYDSVTEFNRAIRVLCMRAGIDESVTLLKTHANRRYEAVYKKYELVSSHTCRRSFCTNHFLHGMPVPLIMAVSGHRTERAFMRYLKIDQDNKVDLFRKNVLSRKKKEELA
jgi:integrase